MDTWDWRKSDQGGIEIERIVYLDADKRVEKIRPRWDWNSGGEVEVLAFPCGENQTKVGLKYTSVFLGHH